MTYQDALGSDFTNHLVSLLTGAALMFLLMRKACKRQVETAKAQLPWREIVRVDKALHPNVVLVGYIQQVGHGIQNI